LRRWLSSSVFVSILPLLAFGISLGQEQTRAAEELSASPGAQHEHPGGSSVEQPAGHQHESMTSQPGGSFAQESEKLLMSLASGTSLNPETAAMHAGHIMKGDWTLMFHGQAFVVDAQQTGPRGEDQIFSPNWGMLMALHPAGEGSMLLRAMLSLEPATVRQGFYPLLFQTGEVADGEPIVDGQHPHDFFMELAFAYARKLGDRSSLLLYAAPVGDPALGPVAFPHRVSNDEHPVATLGHHLQDSTHILYNVLTAGWDVGTLRLEASGFHGEEPDEDRWDLDWGPIDSFSGRITWRPAPEWVTQVSRGRLHDPEEHDPQDITRTTASAIWFHPLPGGHVTAAAIWGRNYLETDHLTLNSYLLEGNWRFAKKNYLFGRWEHLDRNELFANDPAQEAIFEAQGIDMFTIDAFTVGYTRDFLDRKGWLLGAGADVMFYSFPSDLDPFYGSSPNSYHLFLRLRYHGGEAGAFMHGHEHHS
jgi:hypothetical protein